jgi:hypothetical protein
MQHRYFGDVGDFGKYGLLRILSGLDDEQKLKLGVVYVMMGKVGNGLPRIGAGLVLSQSWRMLA